MQEGRTFTVFLVEDSDLLAQLITERLNDANIIVVDRAVTAKDAIDGIAEHQPDAVVLDLLLGDGTGFDVLRALQQDHAGRQPAVFVLTNYSLEPYRQKAKELGAAFFFDKAKEINALVEMLASLAVLRGATQRNAS